MTPKPSFSFFEKKQLMDTLRRVETDFKLVERQFSGMNEHIKSLDEGITNLVKKFTGFFINVQNLEKDVVHLGDINIQQEHRIKELEKQIKELKGK